MRRFHNLFIVLVLVLTLSPWIDAAEFAGGTGQADDPYQIATPGQLIGIGQDPNLQDKHFVLVADLDMDPNLPGGQLLRSGFVLTTGSLDGAGHTISNLGGRIDAPEGYTGRGYPIYGLTLFESIGSEAVVRDLNIEGQFYETPAMLVYKNEGAIINCSAIGSLVDITTSGGATGYNVARGGLVRSNSGTIIGSSVAADVMHGSGLVLENSGVVVACHVTGDVLGWAGLVGTNEGIIRGCYTLGDVRFSENSAGGLVGTNLGSISHCFATGDVTAENHVGGLVGVNSGTVSYCYALGNVLSECEDEDDRCAAGLVAGNEGTITDCYAIGGGGMALVADNDPDATVRSCFALSSRDGGGEDNHLCIVLSDIQMRRQESFVGWDLAGTGDDGPLDDWTMPTDGGYPVLTVLEASGRLGSGTADDPYLIETYPQFLAAARSPQAYYQLTADIDLGGRSFSSPLIPIFDGQIDGDGHRISNFTLTGRTGMGLFGVLNPGAVVVDLHVRQARMTLGNEVPYVRWADVGALAARNKGTVTRCSVVAETSIRMEGAYDNLGGLIGVNEGGQLSMCSARWTITISNPAHCCGGLVAQNTGTVTQCQAFTYANGIVTNLGSLIGRNDGDVADCYAGGYLGGVYSHGLKSPSPTRSLGGLVGSNAGTVTNCYAVTGQTYPTNGGGLVGENSGRGIADGYFLAEADGGGPDNGFGTELSDTEMRQHKSFPGWDFQSIWTICEGLDYPRLRWEAVACDGQ